MLIAEADSFVAMWKDLKLWRTRGLQRPEFLIVDGAPGVAYVRTARRWGRREHRGLAHIQVQLAANHSRSAASPLFYIGVLWI